MKLSLEELMNQKMQKFLEQQTEATRATADVAKQLGKLFEKRRSDPKRPKSSVSVKHSATTDFSEEIKSLISKSESHIPEVITLAENTEKSKGSIQKTISEAIRALSVDEVSTKSGDITEDIADELSSTTDNVETILEQEKSSSRRSASVKESTPKASSASASASSEKLTSSMESFSKFAGKLSQQNFDEQITRLRHKSHLMSMKEKQLEDLFRIKMAKIEKEINDDELLQKQKKKLLAEFKQAKSECKMMRESYKSEEKQLLFVNSQRKKLDREELKLLLQQTSPEIVDVSLLSPSSTSEAASVKSIGLKTDAAKSKLADKVEPEKRKSDDRTTGRRTLERSRSLSLGPTLKPPLSPKSSQQNRRRRHSSAESDDSINVSIAETISDQSDVDIRISALQVSYHP